MISSCPCGQTEHPHDCSTTYVAGRSHGPTARGYKHVPRVGSTASFSLGTMALTSSMLPFGSNASSDLLAVSLLRACAHRLKLHHHLCKGGQPIYTFASWVLTNAGTRQVPVLTLHPRLVLTWNGLVVCFQLKVVVKSSPAKNKNF